MTAATLSSLIWSLTRLSLSTAFSAREYGGLEIDYVFTTLRRCSTSMARRESFAGLE